MIANPCICNWLNDSSDLGWIRRSGVYGRHSDYYCLNYPYNPYIKEKKMTEIKEIQEISKLIDVLRKQQILNKILLFISFCMIASIIIIASFNKPIFNEAKAKENLDNFIQTSLKSDNQCIECKDMKDLIVSLKNIADMINTFSKSSDIGTLLTRIKQDSDVLRKEMLVRLKESQKPIEDEDLKKLDIDHVYNLPLNNPILNKEILSPATSIHALKEGITRELNFLNKNMFIMSNNMMTMGHTMGRMGNWLP